MRNRKDREMAADIGSKGAAFGSKTERFV